MTGSERANFVNTLCNKGIKSTNSEAKKLVFLTFFRDIIEVTPGTSPAK